MNSPTFLGIDPGYDRLGWAVGTVDAYSKLTVSSFGSIETKRDADVFARYQHIQRELQHILDTFHPQELAIESLFFSTNKTTALRVSEVRGVVIGLCLQSQLQIFEYNPSQIKQLVTGSGNADKTMVAKMIALQLHIQTRGTLDDTIDAVAVLLTHSLLRKKPRL